MASRRCVIFSAYGRNAKNGKGVPCRGQRITAVERDGSGRVVTQSVAIRIRGGLSAVRDIDFGKDFLVRRQDRLLFGTDYLEPTQKITQFDLYEEELNLPGPVKRKIFRENARRLLGL